MKLNHLFTRSFAGLALAGVLLANSSVRADDATNAAAPATNNSLFNFKMDTSHKKAGEQNYYGLPKETFDRLPPEQIVALAKSYHDNPSAEMIPEMIATVLIPISMFGMICICVWLGVSQRLKRQRMLHDTIQKMIEKGQSIPPELLQSGEAPQRPKSDLRTGLVLVSVGVGVGIFLFAQQQKEWPAAFIPLLMGVAFLIVWKMEANKKGQPK
jgi:hypothetical protein